MEISFKLVLHKNCLAIVKEKIHRIQLALNEAGESLLTASKSSAGDKHETSRAMIHLEQEKLGGQIIEQQKVYAGLDKIKPGKVSTTIIKGSLINTNNGYFYISESIGRVEVENIKVFVLSAASPIGKLFMGRSLGDEVNFREDMYQINEII